MTLSSAQVAVAAEQAAGRIAGLVRQTPLEHSPQFSADLQADVYFKLENLQHTGSFKFRGAVNRLMTLTAAERDGGCVAASSGNHGAAIALAMHKLNTSGVVFVPQQTSRAKVDAIRAHGGQVEFFGTDGLDTEQHARAYAHDNGMIYLSPYNDEQVIAGQGSCGVEIRQQLPVVDDVFIAVGGGGLVSGIGSVLKTADPDTRIYACQPEASAVMTRSVRAGKILDLPSEPTLSDGTAGGIEPDAITFPLCRELVDEFVVVKEEQIADAMRLFIDRQQQLLEGAAGVAIAGMMACREALTGRKVVAVICGGNISRDTLRQVI